MNGADSTARVKKNRILIKSLSAVYNFDASHSVGY
jgi:hypothetical protein